MPIRVYECDRAEVEQLKRALEYDPYTDSNLLPPSKYNDKDVKSMSAEDKAAMAKDEAERAEKLAKIRADKLLNLIFWKQDCRMRDAASVDIDGDKVYLYISASEEFLNGADEKFAKEFKSLKRAQKADEDKVIAKIAHEEEIANAGFGSIFGN
ncbi:MAG TPA: hypothetical protein VND15_03150 [Candidatus Acidoferrales bacterium]|nr:hypothetical protein [Candidatus Acidoferrales bacterium]